VLTLAHRQRKYLTARILRTTATWLDVNARNDKTTRRWHRIVGASRPWHLRARMMSMISARRNRGLNARRYASRRTILKIFTISLGCHQYDNITCAFVAAAHRAAAISRHAVISHCR